jgi:ppGpp synthetase/RelA/SpoT-type nucleotidyltranferase
MPKRGNVAVPATPADVRAFVDRNRSKFQDTLRAVRQLLEDLRHADPALRSIYKIYGRGEATGGDELKSARKIRLKFNEYNIGCGLTQASLFDTPDVIGLTVVVPYPSGISLVAAALDAAVDAGDLEALDFGRGDADTGIATRHGRALGSKGYLACHYNVRMPGAGDHRPVCEVQIKTLLHDAWGAKTHDLTYKPSGRIGEELLVSFDLLGANLANLDRQSDALRVSIVRAAEVRERKRRVVQIALLSGIAAGAVATVLDVKTRTELEGLLTGIVEMDAETDEKAGRPTVNRLLRIFNDGAGVAGSGVAASTLLSFMAAVTRRSVYYEQALETLDARETAAADQVARLAVRLDAMLAPFAAGDVAEAIDVGEDLNREVEDIVLSGTATSDPARLDRIRLSVLSNLAYFHADLIGSHEGDKRKSLGCAGRYMAAAVALYGSVGYPVGGLAAPDDQIVTAVTAADRVKAAEAFFALDNEAYVGIQCAATEEDLRAMRKRLEFLHQHVPPGEAHLAGLAVDYHDYCARTRLSELERLPVP